MSYTVSTTENNVVQALRTWLLTLLPAGAEVVLGQENRVGVPNSANFVIMTVMNRTRLATNAVRYQDDTAHLRIATQNTQIDVQVDVYGAGASDLIEIISTLGRDDAVFGNFAAQGIAARVLYTGEPRQTAWITGENQYEERWSVDVSIQANISVSMPQEFADAVTVTAVPVS